METPTAESQRIFAPGILRDQVAHFFTHYKDLEKGKWAKVGRWGEAGEAAEIIARAIAQGAKAK